MNLEKKEQQQQQHKKTTGTITRQEELGTAFHHKMLYHMVQVRCV